MSQKIVIKADVLFDGIQRLENKYIIIEAGKIVEISDLEQKFDYQGVVTPGMIDAHSHIGMDREGEPWQEGETNDHISQFNPLNDPMNSIYFDDRAFKDAVDFGVLYSCIVPGSGNLIGGRAKIIRNYASNVDEALVKDYGFKMALGYNPRSTDSWKGSRPTTRMGVYAMLEKKFDEIIRKEKKELLKKDNKIKKLKKQLEKKEVNQKEYEQELISIEAGFKLEFSSEEEAYLELLSGTKTAKIHVHKDDDVSYLIKLVKKYNLKVTADHTGDVFHQETFDKLADNKIPIVYGPLGSVGYKVELKNAFYQNAALLMKSKAVYGLMTDHPVIHTIALRDTLKFFMIHGMTEVEAINLVTRKNAEILGIDDILGSVETGKWASLVVWDKNPLHLGAFPKTVIAEGKVIR